MHLIHGFDRWLCAYLHKLHVAVIARGASPILKDKSKLYFKKDGKKYATMLKIGIW